MLKNYYCCNKINKYSNLIFVLIKKLGRNQDEYIAIYI